MEPAGRDRSPQVRWERRTGVTLSKRGAILSDFRGAGWRQRRSRGEKKKYSLPPPTPQRRVHDPSSRTRTADQYSLNRGEAFASFYIPPPPPDLSASSISSLFPCLFPSVASIPVTSLTSPAQTGQPWTFILPRFLKANADVDTVAPRLLRLVLQISRKLFLLLRNVFDFLINAVICKRSNGSGCSQLTEALEANVMLPKTAVWWSSLGIRSCLVTYFKYNFRPSVKKNTVVSHWCCFSVLAKDWDANAQKFCQ